MEQTQVHQSWFKRNWKWALPVGGCLVVGGLLIAFVVTLFFGVTSMFQESEPYTVALDKAKQSEWVISRLGEPIEETGVPSGNVNYSNGQGTAEILIPIKGPKDTAEIMVWGKKSADTWTYTILKITIKESGEVYDLLNKRLLTGQED